MLIQDRQRCTESQACTRATAGGDAGRWRGFVFSGVSHLSCCSARLHFKNATDKTDGIINQTSAKHGEIAHTLLPCGDDCRLCLFAGVINQCWVVREFNTSWRGNRAARSTLRYTLSSALRERQMWWQRTHHAGLPKVFGFVAGRFQTAN